MRAVVTAYQRIVFDLLGHVYRVAASGGTAEALTQSSGVAVNYQPRISPDGKHFLYWTGEVFQDYDLDAGSWKTIGEGAPSSPMIPL